MTLGTLTVNDIDLDSLAGFRCAIPSGWHDAPNQADQLTSVPGQAGGLLLTTESDVSARTVQLHGYLRQPTAVAARVAEDAVKLLLASPSVEIGFAEVTDRMLVGRYQSMSVQPPAWNARWSTFTLQFLCPNPYPIARSVTVVTVPASVLPSLTVIPLVLGTAPSALDINIIGNGSVNPTVTYFTAQSVIAGSLTFNLTLPVGEWIEWSGQSQRALWHRTGGSTVNATPYLAAGYLTFVADPLDGDGTVGPGIVMANAAAVLSYRKSWR